MLQQNIINWHFIKQSRILSVLQPDNSGCLAHTQNMNLSSDNFVRSELQAFERLSGIMLYATLGFTDSLAKDILNIIIVQEELWTDRTRSTVNHFITCRMAPFHLICDAM